MRCPDCGGKKFIDIGSGWVEYVSDVPYSGAPPELTGLPHPIHQFGPCRHRFEPAAVLAAEAARREAAKRGAEERAEAEAAERAQRERSVAVLERSSNPAKILEALEIRDGLLPTELLKQAWLRLLRCEALATPDREIVTVEGRGTVAGYFLSRGTFTTQWGRWTELKREPAYPAPGAGRRVSPRIGEVPESVSEGFDVLLDATGRVWSGGRPDSSPASLSLTGMRGTEHLIVSRGAQPTFQPRKSQWQGWETSVSGAHKAWAGGDDEIQYARALRAALSSTR